MIDIALLHRTHGTSTYTELCSEIGGVRRIDSQQSLGKTVGDIDLTLSGISDYSEFFSENDSLDLYASYSKLDRSSIDATFYDNNSSAFLMSARLGAQDYNWNEGDQTFEVTGADKTVILTNMIAQRNNWQTDDEFYIIKQGGDDTNSVIHQLVAEINEIMLDADPNWENITISESDMDDTVSYGFLEAAFVFKTYAEIFTELASGAYTNNIQFTFWIDARNALHWKKLGATKDGDLVYSTDEINSVKFKRDVYDTINAAIVNAGLDLNGVGIWWYTVNYASASDVGLRWEIFPDTMFAKEFESITYDQGTATSVSGATLTDSTQSWSTNELQDMWLINPNRGNAAKIVSNTANTITADGEGWRKNDYYIYNGDNASFRSQMKSLALARADAELLKTAKLRYRGDIVINGDASRVLNQVYDFTQPYFGFSSSSPKRMRLTDISHNISAGSWQTQLTFKEDVGTEGEN